MILSAQTIRKRMRDRIVPFHERTITRGMSYGLSCAGYDLRIEDTVVLAPGGFALATTMEWFHFPPDLLGQLVDKSTWARRGVAVQNTIFEPGWYGYPTIEISNHSRDTICICVGDPIAQMIFHQLDERTEQPYNGKYQDQPQYPVPARIET